MIVLPAELSQGNVWADLVLGKQPQEMGLEAGHILVLLFVHVLPVYAGSLITVQKVESKPDAYFVEQQLLPQHLFVLFQQILHVLLPVVLLKGLAEISLYLSLFCEDVLVGDEGVVFVDDVVEVGLLVGVGTRERGISLGE